MGIWGGRLNFFFSGPKFPPRQSTNGRCTVGVPLFKTSKPGRYSDTNGRRTAVQIGGVLRRKMKGPGLRASEREICLCEGL